MKLLSYQPNQVVFQDLKNSQIYHKTFFPSLSSMPTPSTTRHALERSPRRAQGKSSLSKHLQKVYPFSIHQSCSSFTLSSLSLSQNSNDSSFNSSMSSWDHKIPMSFHGMFGSWGRRDATVSSVAKGRFRCRESEISDSDIDIGEAEVGCAEAGSLKRCYWITKSSDEAYISFHDECWGVPVYNDSRLFEMLVLSGMLIDLNWAEILKRRELYREVFAEFDYNVVAKMEEKDIIEISSNKELMLAECRARCIVENARCIKEVAQEFGSFSEYIWGHMNHKPMVNRYKYPKSIPLRTPKAEAISRDLVRRGFRLVGPVIIYSFMQAAGMAIDHLVDCFRFRECVRLAKKSWGMYNMGM